ncbi:MULTISPECIES: hypothetical protein [unclassified Streptomyces]|uniref:hypothetical protein n=1 Tax=unclassified Streptomyces TaxID=2593676 RepID=UPI001F605C4D|nr:hypothetical protein [Streptomyces sp. AN091965]MCI3931830.1 hypothetical protein [Streptomyces sp. AN091965]
MTSARRILAAVSLAAGAAALVAPAAHASTGAQQAKEISPMATIDELGRMPLPEAQHDAVPTVSSQLGGLHRLNELHQVTDLVQPVTQLVPAVQT